MSKEKTPNSKRSQTTLRKKRRPPIRLACVGCDREDYDGVWRVPKNWEDVQRYQTLVQSYEEVSETADYRSAFDWFTYMGTCPECQKADCL